jgi:hypothetical protein
MLLVLPVLLALMRLPSSCGACVPLDGEPVVRATPTASHSRS